MIFPRPWRYIALIFILFASSLPPESAIYPWWVPIGSAYHRMTVVPHHMWARALGVVVLFLWLVFLRRKQWSLLGVALVIQSIGVLIFPTPGVVTAVAIFGVVIIRLFKSLRPARNAFSIANAGGLLKLPPELIFFLSLLFVSGIMFGLLYLQMKSEPSWQAEFSGSNQQLREQFEVIRTLKEYIWVFGLLWIGIPWSIGFLKKFDQTFLTIFFLTLTPYFLIILSPFIGGNLVLNRGRCALRRSRTTIRLWRNVYSAIDQEKDN